MATKTYLSVLGEIRANLARIGMTQQDLGKRAGLTQSTMSRRMTGETSFTLAELYAICDVLGVPAYELLRDADRIPPQRAGATHQKYRPSARPQRHLVLLEAA